MALKTTSLRPTTKYCNSCGQVKERVEFSRNSRASDGLQTYCKECQRNKSLISYYLNHDTWCIDKSYLNSLPSLKEKANWLRSSFGVTSIKDDAIASFESKFGYRVSEITQGRYLTKGGFTRSTLVTRGLRANGRDDRRYTWDNRDYDDKLALEMVAQVQSELRYKHGLNFDKHHSVAQSRGGSYNVSNLRLIPSKLNKWIEQDHYTDEEITKLISVLSSADKNFKQYGWVECLPISEFFPLFVSQFQNRP